MGRRARLGGVDTLFFTSGAELVFYQEAIAKARAHGRPAPRLVTMTHEHACLNAALGYAMVSGKLAAHADAGTLNYGSRSRRCSPRPANASARATPRASPNAAGGSTAR